MKHAIFIRGMARRASKLQDISKNKVILKKPMISLAGDTEIFIPSSMKTSENYYDGSKMTTFSSFQLRDDILEGLKHIPVINPTIIQMIAIPKVLSRQNVFCAAQTGSGKTLVYTIPILNNIRDQADDGFVTRLSRPKALIVAPARELAMQILKWQRDYLKGQVDVVVGTPNTILKYIKRGKLYLSDLQYLVFDEADTLMDENFKDVTNSLLDIIQKKEDAWETKPVQYLFTAATLPKKVILDRYRDFVPNIELCQSNLHKVLSNVKHVFVKTIQQNKADLAVKEIEKFISSNSSHKQCIVFCNTGKSCNWMAHMLNQQNISFSKMHGNMNPQLRFSDFDLFLKGERRILVCTDIASRGLDIPEIALVINLDCPFNSNDYIHRSGRTGRVGRNGSSSGRVVTYVTQRKEVVFAHKIQEAAKKNKALDDIREKKNSEKVRHMMRLTNSFTGKT